MNDERIRDYIETCEQPIIMRNLLEEIRESDPTVSFKRVARILRETGFENRPCKNALNPKGKGSAWFRTENTPVCESSEDETEEDEKKPRTTEEALSDVEKTNERNAELSAKLLESLRVSRNLKDELMRKQQEALLELARRILACYGTERERKIYGGL